MKFTLKESPSIAAASAKNQITKPPIVDQGRKQVEQYIKSITRNESGHTIHGRLLSSPTSTKVLKLKTLLTGDEGGFTLKAQPMIFTGTPSNASLMNRSMKSFKFPEQTPQRTMLSPQH